MTPTDPPTPGEVEVSLLGPGVGESIVIHFGHDDWMIVDSCRGRGVKRPAPLDYLDSIGVDVSTQVRCVVATHAHNDHLRGISEVFEACASAEFVHPEASGNADFFTLLELDDMSDTAPRAYSEYRRVIERVRDRQAVEMRAPMFGIKDGSIVFKRASSGISDGVQAIALAPSDEAVRQAIQEFHDAGNVAGLNPFRIKTDDPNTFCAVIWVSVGDIHFILGSDLLIGPGEDCGWKGVLLSPHLPSTKASLFKVPHHGAPNAHHAPVWEDLLESSPVCLLTPYWAGETGRPSPADQTRICGLTDRAYITCKPSFPAQPDAVLKHAARLRSVATDLKLYRGQVGHIRARRSFLVDEPWKVDLFSPARDLCA